MTGRRIVVGGHSRGVGKTALVAELVRAMAPRPVVTVKVSAHRHGEGRVALEEHTVPDRLTSTGRCLSAGAARAFLCRCPDGRLHEVAVLVRVLSAGGYDVVIESNRMAPLVDADLTLFVASSHTADWNVSSALCLPRADALVLAPGTGATATLRRLAERDRRGSVPVLRFDPMWRVAGLSRWIDLMAPEPTPGPAGRPRRAPAPASPVTPASRGEAASRRA